MKRMLALVLALVLAAGVLVGCGKSDSNDSENDGRTTITVLSAYSLPTFEAALEAAHTDIDLQVEEIATGTINGETSRRLRKGHGSDLIITSLPAGEVKDYTYDLSAEDVVERYQSAITKGISVDGSNRYLPLPGGYYGYIVNKTLIEQLNMELPDTREELLAIFAAAQEQGIGILPDTGYCFGLSDIGATFIGAYIVGDYATDYLSAADGAKWLASFENNDTTFTGNWESCTEFLTACVDNGYMDSNKLLAIYNGRLDTDSNAFKAENQLVDRTAIATFGDIKMYNLIQSNTEDEIVMLSCLPSTDEGNKLLSAVSNNYIAVNKALEADSDKLSAALTVLDFLSTDEGQACWMDDYDCPHSYLTDFTANVEKLPESIREYVDSGMVFPNPFPTNLLSYMGKQLTDSVRGKCELSDALASIDDYYLNGSEDVEYDLSIVGTVSADMLYENSNVRVKETELGNFISDAIREMTGADVALVNGGGIRSSLYAGDITGDDLSAVCPYGNLIIVAEMDGASLRAAVTNGIQKTWKPAGQFLQVSGIKYSFKPAADETQTAELVSLAYSDGTEIKDDDTLTVAYTNYMGGSGGYVDAGDGFTMLNVYDSSLPITVKLVDETNKTYGDALREYFANHKDDELCASLEGRIEVIE